MCARGSLPVVGWCPLFFMCCPLFVVCCCTLLVGRCLLFVVCGMIAVGSRSCFLVVVCRLVCVV